MIATAPSLRIVLYVGPLSAPLDSGLRTTILMRLLERGISVNVVSDLGSLAACPKPGFSSGKPGFIPSQESPANQSLSRALSSVGTAETLVLGNFAGKIPAEISGDVRDISGRTPDEVLAIIEGEPAEALRRWKPWFPVIDFNRCTNCMQCLSFCLFDVYGVTKDGKIQVQNESNCKTDCPACSRVCPEVAIMFPKYKAGPINGDEISSEDVRREAMKVDISALLGGDIYSMLRDRSAKAKSRFSKERDDERALKERQRCLEKLKGAAGDFEVPAEVLASLPSVEQIQLKAEQARKRAAEALELQAAAKAAAATATDGGPA